MKDSKQLNTYEGSVFFAFVRSAKNIYAAATFFGRTLINVNSPQINVNAASPPKKGKLRYKKGLLTL